VDIRIMSLCLRVEKNLYGQTQPGESLSNQNAGSIDNQAWGQSTMTTVLLCQVTRTVVVVRE